MNQSKGCFIKAAILGSGKIGCDLLMKLKKIESVRCGLMIGRSLESQGMIFARNNDCKLLINGRKETIDELNKVDVVFDATSALSHKKNLEYITNRNTKIINLTPARYGEECVPTVNIDRILNSRVIDMITCGGQSSIPLVHAIASVVEDIKYIEVVSTISSCSAGLATRENINEYIENTEASIKSLAKCKSAKVIININPSEPPVEMKTTLYIIPGEYKINEVRKSINNMIEKMKYIVPDYKLVLGPQVRDDAIVLSVKIKGNGDYLPKYAGNLDIITSAAVYTAERLFNKV